MANEGRHKNIKGVRIQTLNYLMIVVSFVSFIIVIWQTVIMQSQFDDLISATESYLACENSANKFSDASDLLSENARLYVINGNKECLENYFNELNVSKRREAALDEAAGFDSDGSSSREMEHAKDKADRLTERELYAMRLAAEARGEDIEKMDERIGSVELTAADEALSPSEKLLEARERVFGSVYQNERQAISGFIVKFIDRQVSVINDKQKRSADEMSAALERQTVFISLLFVMNIVIFVIILNFIIRPLKIYMDCIKDGQMLKIVGSYEFKYLALTYNSIYEINAANEQMLKHKAEHDSLTGLMNRGAFDQFAILCGHSCSNIALMIVDVDKFKQINDGYGHAAGDLVLQKVAKLLLVNFRSTDCVARMGGDEFCVIMLDVTQEAKDNISEKIRAINAAVGISENGVPAASVSAGIAFSDNGYDEQLYLRADSALYYVKEHGRGGHAFYEESMSIKSEK